ncbi:hypothetical protein [Cronobacter dublinensis]|uniref:hypothetical protein n=1 Tax=Cronobacter dublinensis TaxID=413497 RepID=UPI00300E4DAA
MNNEMDLAFYLPIVDGLLQGGITFPLNLIIFVAMMEQPNSFLVKVKMKLFASGI